MEQKLPVKLVQGLNVPAYSAWHKKMPFGFTNKTAPNFTSTVYKKLHPTLKLYAL